MSSMKVTPMFEQYLSIKQEAPDALLLFRMGDFYEFFLEDAIIASKELQITLTCRNPKMEHKIEMCGVPWHSIDSYIATLVKKGYTVAICDQVEDPKESKGIVKRAITRIITPGTVIEENVLEAKEYNFLAAVYFSEKTTQGALAWVDVSTGKWAGFSTTTYAHIQEWIHKIQPKELLMPDSMYINKEEYSGIHLVRVPERAYYSLEFALKAICKATNVHSIESTGLQGNNVLIQVCGALLTYLQITQKCTVEHLQTFEILDFSTIVLIDEQTEKNLELFTTTSGKKGKGTFFHTIDRTKTNMGGRFLEERIKKPYRDKTKILDTQEAIEFFVEHPQIRKTIEQYLERIDDIERLSNRIALQRTHPKDFIMLKQSLILQKELGDYLLQHEEIMPALFIKILDSWDTLEEVILLLSLAFQDPPPATFADGGIFNKEYNTQLHELIDLLEKAEEHLDTYITEEQSNTNNKLKLGYTKLSGYYIEVSKNAKHPLPEYFIRKQTLANAERYTTPRLLAIEEKLCTANEDKKLLELSLLHDIYKKIRLVHSRIVFMASLLAHIDYLQGFAKIAIEYSWVKPTIVQEKYLAIQAGRHPVVEDLQGKNNFIPNDLTLHSEKTLALITGPNMGGKSTLLRQTALICILAQMGSYVPALSATIGIVDKIFCRVGASDNLSKGQSTFMVEMIETSRILRSATPSSLLIIDEIGRGTSTFDGLAIAWAIVEDLTKQSLQARTLFATHYHELPSLEHQISHIFSLHFAIKEENGTLLFLKQLRPGPADRSYGIEVAKLAGIPNTVVLRAKNLLKDLEKTAKQKNMQIQHVLDLEDSSINKIQHEVSYNSIVEEDLKDIKNLDITNVTPLKAFEIITTLWNKLQ